MDQLQSEHQTQLHQLLESNHLLAACRSQQLELDQSERSPQCRENSVNEISITYRKATEAVRKASERLQVEVDKREALQLELAQCEKRHHAIRDTLTNVRRDFEVSQEEVKSLRTQLSQIVESELNSA